MDAITRSVRDLDDAGRRVLEQVIGRRLTDNQQLIIRVADVVGPPTPGPPKSPRSFPRIA